MSLNIKSEEAERLVRQLASETGESITGAVTVAVSERLERVRRAAQDEATGRIRRIREIGIDAATRWREPFRSVEHGDLLYDEVGLPK